jgi:1-phosphofructokinase
MQATHLNSSAAVVAPRLLDEFVAFFAELGQSGDICALSGSVPHGVKDSIYQELIKLCKKKKMITALDTRDMPLKMGVRAKPDMLKPNQAELESLFDEQVRGVHHIALKGKRLLDMGIKSVFISLGTDGMIAIHENDCLLCNAPQVKVRDTVGCGDAMVAGLLVAKARKFSFSETCRMAIACGASNAMHEGPGVIDRHEVAALMEDVMIESV